MKRYLLLLPLLLLLTACIPDAPTQTVQGTVVDRAMDGGMAYVGIQPDRGEGFCVYAEQESQIPEDLTIGDRAEITFRILPQEHGERYLAVEIRKLG